MGMEGAQQQQSSSPQARASYKLKYINERQFKTQGYEIILVAKNTKSGYKLEQISSISKAKDDEKIIRIKREDDMLIFCSGENKDKEFLTADTKHREIPKIINYIVEYCNKPCETDRKTELINLNEMRMLSGGQVGDDLKETILPVGYNIVVKLNDFTDYSEEQLNNRPKKYFSLETLKTGEDGSIQIAFDTLKVLEDFEKRREKLLADSMKLFKESEHIQHSAKLEGMNLSKSHQRLSLKTNISKADNDLSGKENNLDKKDNDKFDF